MAAKNYKAKFILAKLAMLAAALLLITSCNPFGPYVLEKSDMPKSYNVEQNYRTISANSSKWLDTGISLGENYGYIIRVNGGIFLCNTQSIYTIPSSSPSDLVQVANDGSSIKLKKFDQVFIYPAPSSESSATDPAPSPLQGSTTKSALDGLSVYADNDSITTTNDAVDLVSQKLQEYKVLPPGTLPKNVAGLSQASIAAIQSSSFITAIASNSGGILGLAYQEGVTHASDQSFRVVYNSCAVINGANHNGNQGKVQFLISSDDPNISGGNGSTIIDGNMYKEITSYSGNIWARVYDCDDCYSDNNGTYQLSITSLIPAIDNTFSHLIKLIVNPVKKSIKNVQTVIFAGFSQSNKFQVLVKSTLILYISIYGLYFALGLAKVSQKDFVIRIFKIALVITLISASAWNFFNDHFFKLFDEGASYILASSTGQAANNQFGFIDTAMALFFAKQTWLKISSFLLSVPGWVFLIIFIYSLFTYMLIIITSIVSYLFSYTGLAIVISIGPLFMIAILFEPTRNYFNNWIKEIVNFAFQPILLFTSIIIVNQMIIEMFLSVMSFQAVWGCKIPIYFNLGSLGKLDLFCFKMYCPGTSCADSGTLNIFAFIPKMMVFVMLIQFLKYLLQLIPEISERLVHSMTNTGDAAASAVQGAASTIGWDDNSANNAKNGATALSYALRPKPPLTQNQHDAQEAKFAQQYSKNAQASFEKAKQDFDTKAAEFGPDYKVGIKTQKADLDVKAANLSDNRGALLADFQALHKTPDNLANLASIKTVATNMEALHIRRHDDLKVELTTTQTNLQTSLQTNEQKLNHSADLQTMEEGGIVNFDSPIYMDQQDVDKVKEEIATNRKDLDAIQSRFKELEEHKATIATAKEVNELSTTLETALNRSGKLTGKHRLIEANNKIIRETTEKLNEALVKARALQEKELAANRAESQKVHDQLRELADKERNLDHLKRAMDHAQLEANFFEKDSRAQELRLNTTRNVLKKADKATKAFQSDIKRHEKDILYINDELNAVTAKLNNTTSKMQKLALQEEQAKLIRKQNLQRSRLEELQRKQTIAAQRITDYQANVEEIKRLKKEVPALAERILRSKKGNPNA